MEFHVPRGHPMRNIRPLLAAFMLFAAQVAQATSLPATASAEVTTSAVAQVKQITLDTKNTQPVTVVVEKTPDFDTEVLVPLRKAQEDKAKAEAARIAAARAAAQTAKPATKPVSYSATGPLNEAQIKFLGYCESGMTATRNSGNGFYGAFQFTISTWNAMKTGYDRADHAPLDVQIGAVQKLLSRSSIYTQFPGCARKMHAQGLI